jgi:hypothetical protein
LRVQTLFYHWLSCVYPGILIVLVTSLTVFLDGYSKLFYKSLQVDRTLFYHLEDEIKSYMCITNSTLKWLLRCSVHIYMWRQFLQSTVYGNSDSVSNHYQIRWSKGGMESDSFGTLCLCEHLNGLLLYVEGLFWIWIGFSAHHIPGNQGLLRQTIFFFIVNNYNKLAMYMIGCLPAICKWQVEKNGFFY